MAKFERHYRIEVQRDDDASWEGQSIRLPGERSPERDEQALRAAVGLAHGLIVGADGRCEFGGYTVYVSHYRAFGQSELLACVTRAYSWDQSEDYTYAKNHCGHLDTSMHERVTAELGA